MNKSSFLDSSINSQRVFEYNFLDEKQFPILNGIGKKLDSHIAKNKNSGINKFMVNIYHEWQDPHGERVIVSEEQRKKDILEASGIVISGLISIPNTIYIQEVKHERDAKFAISIPTKEQRDYNIAMYNKYVIGEIEGFINWIYRIMTDIFGKHFDEVQKEKIPCKYIFEKWYDEFNCNQDLVNKIVLKSIFNEKNNAFQTCLDLMEDLQITEDNRPNPNKLKDGRAGTLIGMITAIKETPHMLKLDNPTEMQLLNYFNTHLNTNYSTFSKRSKAYTESRDDATRYIKLNFKK